MDMSYLFRESWQITWRCRQMWWLTLVMFIVFLPALILSVGFGGVAAALVLPVNGLLPDWLAPFRQLPTWAWLGAAAVGLVMLVVSTAASWVLQAGMMRLAESASAGQSLTLSQALSLSRKQVMSIIKLSITFGLLIALMAFAPLLILLALPPGELNLALMNLASTALTPLNAVISIALLLIMMSIALEDVQPRAAMGRAWQVFRSGWWAFLVVLVLSGISGVVLTILLVPVAFAGAMAFVFDWGWILLLGCLSLTGPVALAALLFTAIFTLVMYTLVYKASSGIVEARVGMD